MYIGDIKHNEDFHSLVLQAIRDIGVKHRHKKNIIIKNHHDAKLLKVPKIFRRPLNTLTTDLVTLKSGTLIEVPSFVVEACNHIKLHCDVEGIFRKAGSAARVREIKAIVDCGKRLESKHHVIDVSNILKLFFRELPEPLLPYVFHDLLLRCLLVKERTTEGILMTCLLFPLVHLNTLMYLMEFFRDVADKETSNKMGISNLAIIITPSLMPVEEKNVHSGTRLGHHVRVIEILMKNAEKIGMLPEYLVDKALSNGCVLSNSEEIENTEIDESKIKKKKKRRSGSLTRMINGLKKMVGKGSPEISDDIVIATPDFSSPCVKSAKKRKFQESTGAFSSKKKRDILQSLPQSTTLANAPCTPLPAAIGELYYTPRVHSHPNSATTKSESRLKTRLSVGRKSGKKLKKPGDTFSVSNDGSDYSRRSEKGPMIATDWQWKNGPWKRKKCLSSSDTPSCSADIVAQNKSSDSVFCSDSPSCTSLFDAGVDLSNSSESDLEFVKIPKSEYEEIKNRVSAIENRISQEFGSISADPAHGLDDIPLIDESEDDTSRATKVQNAYEKTLEESEKLGDPVSTDQLAKRLSRELKIRHSLENKVIRSPSARKIGTIRRRSRENARSSLDKINKNSSPKRAVRRQTSLTQNSPRLIGQEQGFSTRSALRRGRPNTLYTGLPHPTPLRATVAVTFEDSNASFANESQSVKELKPSETVHSDSSCSQSISISESNIMCQQILPSLNYVQERNPSQSEVRRTSSFHGTELVNNNTCDKPCDMRKSLSQGNVTFRVPKSGKKLTKCYSNVESNDKWENAPQFFKKSNSENVPVSGRESVARIRNQNAGMVLARMRLFDKKQDPSTTPSRHTGVENDNEDKPERKLHAAQNSAQSLRIRCMQDNFLEKLNTLHLSEESGHSNSLTSLRKSSPIHSLSVKVSPKKIGTPRKKYIGSKSPKGVAKKQKPKISKSPQYEQPIIADKDNTIKKSVSLRETIHRSPLTSNISATSVLNYGKENLTSSNNFGLSPLTKVTEKYEVKQEMLQQIQLPDNLKETIYDVCTPRVEKLSKMSVSPLKDCNRIDINAVSQFEGSRMNAYKTPMSSPYIKKPLLVKSPTTFVRTPFSRTPALESRSHRNATPLKALPNSTLFTPTCRNLSPIVHGEKSRNHIKT